jgi:hypothetical protein
MCGYADFSLLFVFNGVQEGYAVSDVQINVAPSHLSF